jgi:hypothetical protein
VPSESTSNDTDALSDPLEPEKIDAAGAPVTITKAVRVKSTKRLLSIRFKFLPPDTGTSCRKATFSILVARPQGFVFADEEVDGLPVSRKGHDGWVGQGEL